MRSKAGYVGWGLLAVLTGCQAEPASLLPVRGKITFQGAAVQGGIVVFTPDNARGNHGRIASGEIQTDGSYTLRTERSFGAAAGWYRVTVAAIGAEAAALPGHRYGIPSSLLPERYRDPELSRLVCEVKADIANSIDFNLD